MTTPRLEKKSALFNFMNVQPTFTQDERPKSTREGAYSKEEWLETRRVKDSFYDVPSVFNLKGLHWGKFDGIKAICDLASIYDFSTKKCIGELGGIPFVQAWVLIELYPEIDFLLTDADGIDLSKFDPFLKDHQSRFRNGDESKKSLIETKEFDLHTDSLEVFSYCDLIMVWGVDYALQDSDLSKLFKYCLDKDIPLLIATMTPKNNYSRFIFWGKRNNILRSIFHKEKITNSLVGYFRTKKYFLSLAKENKLNCEEMLADGKYSIYLFTSNENET